MGNSELIPESLHTRDHLSSAPIGRQAPLGGAFRSLLFGLRGFFRSLLTLSDLYYEGPKTLL